MHKNKKVNFLTLVILLSLFLNLNFTNSFGDIKNKSSITSSYDNSDLSSSLNTTLDYGVIRRSALVFEYNILESIDYSEFFSEISSPFSSVSSSSYLELNSLFENLNYPSTPNETSFNVYTYRANTQYPIYFYSGNWDYEGYYTKEIDNSYQDTMWFVFPQDIFIEDIFQNNTLYLEQKLYEHNFNNLNFTETYDMVNDTIKMNQSLYSANFTDIYNGNYNASIVFIGNSTIGTEINITTSITSELSINPYHHYIEEENYNFLINFTIYSNATGVPSLEYYYVNQSFSRNLQYFESPFLGLSYSNTEYSPEYSYDYWEEVPTEENQHLGPDIEDFFKIIFGLILLAGFIVLIEKVARSSKRSNKYNFPRNSRNLSQNCGNVFQNVPLNKPIENNGRENTYSPSSYERIPQSTASPSSILPKFCPECGGRFSKEVFELLRINKKAFCSYCGTTIDF